MKEIVAEKNELLEKLNRLEVPLQLPTLNTEIRKQTPPPSATTKQSKTRKGETEERPRKSIAIIAVLLKSASALMGRETLSHFLNEFCL